MSSPFQHLYPPELGDRAVRMVHEAIAESGERAELVTRVVRQLGIGPESLHNWVKPSDIESGKRAGMTSAEQRRIVAGTRESRIAIGSVGSRGGSHDNALAEAVNGLEKLKSFTAMARSAHRPP